MAGRARRRARACAPPASLRVTVVPGDMPGERAPQRAAPAMAGSRVGGGQQRPAVEDALELRAVEQLLERASTTVAARSRIVRAGLVTADAVDRVVDIRRRRGSRAVDAEARTARRPGARQRHVDQHASLRAAFPQSAAAEAWLSAAAGPHASTAASQRPRVGTEQGGRRRRRRSMHPVQPPRRRPAARWRSAQPELDELPAIDDAVLVAQRAADRAVHRMRCDAGARPSGRSRIASRIAPS